MGKKQKRLLVRIGAALTVFVGAMALPLEGWIVPATFVAAYLLAGGDIVWKAVRNLTRGRVFDENFLMTVATLGAFALGEYPEGVAVMVFYQVGEWFQRYAVGKSRRSIAELMDIRPDIAHVQRGGDLVTVSPEDVRVGEVVVVKPGERIPLDGRVVDGHSSVDTAALTGESVPRDVEPGRDVVGGCVNRTGRLTVRVAKEYGQSTVAKILELVEHAADRKSRSETFIHRFAKVYTPLVVGAAVLLATLPPLLSDASFAVWVERALTFLVISCPCALVISVPLSFFGGIGGASKSGVLVKGSQHLETLADVDVVVFDKTGTLTHGSFEVTEAKALHRSRDELLELAAYAEHGSNHPVAESLGRAYGGAVDAARIGAVEEIPGHGMRAVVDGRVVLVGNARLMQRGGVATGDGPAPAGTVVYVAMDGRYEGHIRIEDEIKADAAQAMVDLRRAGVGRLVMLTGDADAVGQDVASRLGLDRAYTELLPADKVERVEELMAEKGGRGKLAFVGDGINDAPVLARADVGIAMGGMGSDAAMEAADVVIMTDEPSRVAVAMRTARRTLSIVRQNIVFALGVKGVVLGLGAFGLASMWAAVFADVGVSVLAILNAMRALRVEKPACRCSDGPSAACPIHHATRTAA